MLEDVDRLVDLAGIRSAALMGASHTDLGRALAACDTTRLGATDGHFAGTARDGKTVRLARTIGFPLRYFVAKMYHGPFLVVAERMSDIFGWCRDQRIAWQFEAEYTRMVPAHVVVELDQVGCPDPAPRYHRFFDPPVAQGPPDIEAAGTAYVEASYQAVRRWLTGVPDGEPVAVAFSGGVDSTAVLLLARQALADLGRDAALLRAFTLDLGGGSDAAQAETVIQGLGLGDIWERVTVPPEAFDLAEAISTIEDYHPLDVECAAAALCLLREVRARYPRLRYLLDGDGGDENLKSYPLEDSDLTLSSLLRNPLLYQEGWGIDAIKHSLAYSGGLSRGYVRTYAPAAACGFDAFSPFTVRSVIAAAVAIPFEQVLAGSPERLTTLKHDVVRAGMRAVLDIEMPLNPKRRFQDGVAGVSRPRVSKAWCRSVFEQQWQARAQETDTIPHRSGNEMTLAIGVRAHPG